MVKTVIDNENELRVYLGDLIVGREEPQDISKRKGKTRSKHKSQADTKNNSSRIPLVIYYDIFLAWRLFSSVTIIISSRQQTIRRSKGIER